MDPTVRTFWIGATWCASILIILAVVWMGLVWGNRYFTWEHEHEHTHEAHGHPHEHEAHEHPHPWPAHEHPRVGAHTHEVEVR